MVQIVYTVMIGSGRLAGVFKTLELAKQSIHKSWDHLGVITYRVDPNRKQEHLQIRINDRFEGFIFQTEVLEEVVSSL